MTLPNCPWLRVDLLWPWDTALGRAFPYDSTDSSGAGFGEERVLWLSAQDGHPVMGVTMSETSVDEGSTATVTRMVLYAMAGGLLVMIAGWLLLLPQRGRPIRPTRPTTFLPSRPGVLFPRRWVL